MLRKNYAPHSIELLLDNGVAASLSLNRHWPRFSVSTVSGIPTITVIAP